jgi:DUF4097 and DUF4098 domain-containing protein YvlB
MHRHLVLTAALFALAMPATGSAQTQTDRDRERERERIERERDRVREVRERQQEKAQEARDRAQEARDRVRRDREAERSTRDAAGVLDTVVAFDARGSVTVSCPRGAVVVTTADRAEIRVRARTGRGAIRFTSNGTRAALEPTAGGGCSDGHFEVVVPTGSRVSANTWSGSITVRGVAGDLDAHAMSGSVEIHDVGGRLEAESLSGDIAITGVKGEALVHTVSGDVTLDAARGAVEVETVSGDLTLRDLSGREVRTHTTSGDLTFSGLIVDGGRYDFESHSGELRLRLPANVGAQLSLTTFNGSIESDFPITLKAGTPGMGSTSTKRMDFALGQGTARIIAETFSGDITLTSNGRRQ